MTIIVRKFGTDFHTYDFASEAFRSNIVAKFCAVKAVQFREDADYGTRYLGLVIEPEVREGWRSFLKNWNLELLQGGVVPNQNCIMVEIDAGTFWAVPEASALNFELTPTLRLYSISKPQDVEEVVADEIDKTITMIKVSSYELLPKLGVEKRNEFLAHLSTAHRQLEKAHDVLEARTEVREEATPVQEAPVSVAQLMELSNAASVRDSAVWTDALRASTAGESNGEAKSEQEYDFDKLLSEIFSGCISNSKESQRFSASDFFRELADQCGCEKCVARRKEEIGLRRRTMFGNRSAEMFGGIGDVFSVIDNLKAMRKSMESNQDFVSIYDDFIKQVKEPHLPGDFPSRRFVTANFNVLKELRTIDTAGQDVPWVMTPSTVQLIMQHVRKIR